MGEKHTPGPWLIDDESFVYGLNAQGYNRFHAHVQGGNTAPMEKTTAAEIRANARLMAVAPDLLQAVHEMLCHIQEPDERDFLDANKFKWQQEAFRKARAAISKATGQ